VFSPQRIDRKINKLIAKIKSDHAYAVLVIIIVIIAYITTMMMIHPKKFKKMLVKQQVAKTAQDIFMGLGSWHPAAKEHMMAYDKQTIKRLYNDVRR